MFVLDASPNALVAGCDLVGINPLTYTIESKPELLPEEAIAGAIESAFDSWHKAIPHINFKHVQGDVNATFKFSWTRGPHGDCQCFDSNDPGGILAHAFCPGDCGFCPPGQNLPGECHFDRMEQWGFVEDPASGTIDIQTVALHEIGHLLGLRGSTDENSIMFEDHQEVARRELKESDVAFAAIRIIYGTP